MISDVTRNACVCVQDICRGVWGEDSAKDKTARRRRVYEDSHTVSPAEAVCGVWCVCCISSVDWLVDQPMYSKSTVHSWGWSHVSA